MNRPCNKYIYFRYVERNIRRFSEHRKYNNDLPKWVHNKPKYFTKHCIEKINLAKDIKQENVKYVESIEGQYFLVETSTIGKCYKVNLGNEDTFPKCECDAWKRSLLPCNHMVSIVEYFAGFGWKALPVTYKTSKKRLKQDFKTLKKRKMLFSDNEKKLIEGNEMLTDESINLAMGLIHEQFPHIGGLTDSSIGKCQQYDIVPRGNGYI